MFCESVTIGEIYNIVASIRNNKSPGSDNIGPKLVKFSCMHLSVLVCLLAFLLYVTK